RRAQQHTQRAALELEADIANGGEAIDQTRDIDELNAHARPPLSATRLLGVACCAEIQASRAAISGGVSLNPSLDRRHTMSSVVAAHSSDIRYLTSASVKLAPNDWPRSSIVFAMPRIRIAR